MPYRRRLLFVALLGGSLAQAAPDSLLTLQRSFEMLRVQSVALRIADQRVESALRDRRRADALWYPTLNLTGAYVRLSNDVAVKQSLAPLADGLDKLLGPFADDIPALEEALSGLAQGSFTLPLVPRNVTSFDLNLSWPVFVGGKRLYAARIARAGVHLADEGRRGVVATEQVRLATAYFGVELADSVVEVRRRVLQSMKMHRNDAQALERCGMLDKAGRLTVDAAVDAAASALDEALGDRMVAVETFRSLLELDTSALRLSTPMFVCDTLPTADGFKTLAGRRNAELAGLAVGSRMADDRLRIERSNYLPEVALVARQNLYAHGLSHNLMPRSLVGVGLSWTLFDGLYRENTVRAAQIDRESVRLSEQQARDRIRLDIDKFHTQLLNVGRQLVSLRASLLVNRELVRMRRSAFREGMATPTETIDAEVALAEVEVAVVAACYRYDVTLAALFALCGEPDRFFDCAARGVPVSLSDQ